MKRTTFTIAKHEGQRIFIETVKGYKYGCFGIYKGTDYDDAGFWCVTDLNNGLRIAPRFRRLKDGEQWLRENGARFNAEIKTERSYRFTIEIFEILGGRK